MCPKKFWSPKPLQPLSNLKTHRGPAITDNRQSRCEYTQQTSNAESVDTGQWFDIILPDELAGCVVMAMITGLPEEISRRAKRRQHRFKERRDPNHKEALYPRYFEAQL